EREVPLFPGVAPVLDHRREEFPVFGGTVRVRFALIPDDPANGEWLQGRDHRVVQIGSLEVLQIWILVEGLAAPAAVPRGAADVRVNQSDGSLAGLLQVAAEVVADRRETRQRLRPTLEPGHLTALAGQLALRGCGPDAVDTE